MKKVLKYGLITIGVLWAGLITVSIIKAIIGPSVPDDSILRVTFNGEMSDSNTDPLAALTGDPSLTIHDVTFGIRAAAKDEKILGLVLDIRAPALSVAQVEDVADAMRDYRESGKWSVAFLETAGEFSRGDGNYAIAVCADEVILTPPGEVNLIGLSADVPFIKGVLEKLKIQPFIGKRYDYKNAANMFTETEFTEPHREATKALVDDLQAAIVAHIAERRGVEADAVTQWMTKGTHSAKEALEAKMVDTLAYWDAVETKATEAGKRDDPWISLARYQSIRDPGDAEHTMAFILGDGQIVRGDGGGIGDDSMASGPITKAFRDARKDEVKGVLFRVNSPGGSYIASDLIRREVEITREAGIPVVVSMGSLAASGGYFVSMGADKIIAQPSTITGSIGVFAGRFAMRDFLAWMGVTFDSYKASPVADTFGWLDPPDEESQARVDAALDRIYDDFISKAADGRSLTKDEVHNVAQGRVWSGKAALERKLVDMLGDTKVAARELKKAAGLDPDEAVMLGVYPKPKTPVEIFKELLKSGASVSGVLLRLAHAVEQGVSTQSLQSPVSPPVLY